MKFKHGRKLTEQQASEVREWYAARRALPSIRDMCKRYGVTDKTIYLCGRGFQYKRQRAERELA